MIAFQKKQKGTNKQTSKQFFSDEMRDNGVHIWRVLSNYTGKARTLVKKKLCNQKHSTYIVLINTQTGMMRINHIR